MGFTVPWWARLGLAVLQELRGPTGAHAQVLVRHLAGLLVQADDHSLLHAWNHTLDTRRCLCSLDFYLL